MASFTKSICAFSPFGKKATPKDDASQDNAREQSSPSKGRVKRNRPADIDTEGDDGKPTVRQIDPRVERTRQQLLKDKRLKESMKKRVNLEMLPSDDAFQKIRCMFDNELREHCITHIIETHFAPCERALLILAEEFEAAALVEIQEENKVLYRDMLLSEPFKEWAPKADLAFKLAFLYFGFPVAPVTIDYTTQCMTSVQPPRRAWGEADEGEPADGHLRVLNRYTTRLYGHDGDREADPLMETYYEFDHKTSDPVSPELATLAREREFPSMVVRGGGDFDGADEQEEHDECIFNADLDNVFIHGHEEDTHLVLRGGATSNEADSNDHSAIRLDAKVTFHNKSSSQSGPNAKVSTTSATTDKTSSSASAKSANMGSKATPATARPAPARHPLCAGAAHAADIQHMRQMKQHQRLRQSTYAYPISAHKLGTYPIYVPPVEHFLQLKSDAFPKVSLAVLTASETRKLQEDHYNMRNLALDRSVACPFDGCSKVYALTDSHKLSSHCSREHRVDECPFRGCTMHKLWRVWTAQERVVHIARVHGDLVLQHLAHGEDRDLPAPPSNGLTARAYECNWHYCPRCGRDHYVLSPEADRGHHDNVCVPTNDTPAPWGVCRPCGDLYRPQGGSPSSGTRPHCARCVLDFKGFTAHYVNLHRKNCRGIGHANKCFCPWCGIKQVDNAQSAYDHTQICKQRPRAYNVYDRINDPFLVGQIDKTSVVNLPRQTSAPPVPDTPMVPSAGAASPSEAFAIMARFGESKMHERFEAARVVTPHIRASFRKDMAQKCHSEQDVIEFIKSRVAKLDNCFIENFFVTVVALLGESYHHWASHMDKNLLEEEDDNDMEFDVGTCVGGYDNLFRAGEDEDKPMLDGPLDEKQEFDPAGNPELMKLVEEVLAMRPGRTPKTKTIIPSTRKTRRTTDLTKKATNPTSRKRRAVSIEEGDQPYKYDPLDPSNDSSESADRINRKSTPRRRKKAPSASPAVISSALRRRNAATSASTGPPPAKRARSTTIHTGTRSVSYVAGTKTNDGPDDDVAERVEGGDDNIDAVEKGKEKATKKKGRPVTKYTKKVMLTPSLAFGPSTRLRSKSPAKGAMDAREETHHETTSSRRKKVA